MSEDADAQLPKRARYEGVNHLGETIVFDGVGHPVVGDPSRFKYGDAPAEFKFQTASREIAKRAPRVTEDAHYCSTTSMAVFDGVGASDNAGPFARKLCLTVSATDGNPYERLLAAHAATKGDEGMSTACVARICGRNLEVANLGDSGFRLMRDGKIIARSVDQFITRPHGDCPYALGDYLDCGYHPDAADPYIVELQKGDILVLASDGLFDNLNVSAESEMTNIRVIAAQAGISDEVADDRILAALKDDFFHQAKGTAQQIADALFAACFGKWGNQHLYSRSREDDITVVVGVVE